MVESEDLVELLRVYWAELGGTVLALAGAAVAVQRGDALVGLLAVVLLVVLVDRIRLRMDNRSLSRVLRERRAGDRADADPADSSDSTERRRTEVAATSTE
jgi:hypothetical protein